MPERSADWFAQAERDLQGARWLADGGFHEWACFAAQQAAEKAVKAVYQRLAGDAWGHSVTQLLVGLQEKISVSDALMTCARKLDRFYIPARYPNGWDMGTPKDYFSEEDSSDAIRCSEEIIRFCDRVLAR